jgi:hypothetical protein
MSFFCSRNASIQKAVVVLAMIELRRYYFWRTTVRIRVSNEKARLAPAGGWLTKKKKKVSKRFSHNIPHYC